MLSDRQNILYYKLYLIIGYCACGGTCDGVIKNDPNDNFLEITCTITKGNGKCGKRCLRSEKRKNTIAEIGQDCACISRRKSCGNHGVW